MSLCLVSKVVQRALHFVDFALEFIFVDTSGQVDRRVRCKINAFEKGMGICV